MYIYNSQLQMLQSSNNNEKAVLVLEGMWNLNNGDHKLIKE